MSQAPQNDDNKQDDDPLAELARIVSEGSIFGSVHAGNDTTKKSTIPAVEPAVESVIEREVVPEVAETHPIEGVTPVVEQMPPSQVIMPQTDSDFIVEPAFTNKDNIHIDENHMKVETEVLPVQGYEPAMPPVNGPLVNEEQNVDDVSQPYDHKQSAAVSSDDSSFGKTIEDELLDEITAAEAVMLDAVEPAISKSSLPEPTAPSPAFDLSSNEIEAEQNVQNASHEPAFEQPHSVSPDFTSNSPSENIDSGSIDNLIDQQLIASLEEEILKEAFPDSTIKDGERPLEQPDFEALSDQPENKDFESEKMPKEERENKSPAVEEALNLDSFFDNEFGRTNQKIAPTNADKEKPSEGILAGSMMGYPDVSLNNNGASDIDRSSKQDPEFNLIKKKEQSISSPRDEQVNIGLSDKKDFDFDEPVDDFTVEEPVVKVAKKGRGLVAIAATLSLLVVSAAGAYYLFSSASSDNEFIVSASDDPIKVRPDEPGGKLIPNQDRTVYDTLSGDEVAQRNDGQLVDRSEKPIVNLDKGDDGIRPRVVLPGSSSGEEGVSSTRPPRGTRTVRTVTIRPDGTLVRNQEAKPENFSGQNETKTLTPSIVANSNETAKETVSQNLTPRSVNTAILPNDTTSNEVAPEEAVNQAQLPPLPKQNDLRNRATLRQTAQASNPTPLSPSAPRGRPLQQDVDNQTAPAAQAQQQTQPAETPESVPAANVSPSVSTNGGFFVQLSSQRSEDQARSTFNSLKRRFSVLSAYSANIQRADLGERGIYHRLRVGPFSREESVRLCETLKASGGDCIIARR